MKKSLLLYSLLFITTAHADISFADRVLSKGFEDSMKEKLEKAEADKKEAEQKMQQAKDELLSTEKDQKNSLAEKEYLSALNKYAYCSYKAKGLQNAVNYESEHNENRWSRYDWKKGELIKPSSPFNSKREALVAGINSIKFSTPEPEHYLSESIDFAAIHTKAKSDLLANVNNHFASPLHKSDTVKLGMHCYSILKKIKNGENTDIERLLPLVAPIIGIFSLEDESSTYYKQQPAMELIKHYLWYRPMVDGISEQDSNLGLITTPVAFVSADIAIRKAAHTLNKYDSIKNFTDSLSEDSRTFLYENGKMVAASGCAELARTAVEQRSAGMTYENAIQFGKKATAQFGSYFGEKYCVEPLSNFVCGEKNSKEKTAFRFAATTAVVLGLHATLGQTATIEIDLTPENPIPIVASIQPLNGGKKTEVNIPPTGNTFLVDITQAGRYIAHIGQNKGGVSLKDVVEKKN